MTKKDIVALMRAFIKKGTYEHSPEYFELPGYKIERVETKGGEDQGSYYHNILKFEKDDGTEFYMKCTGHYDSWSDVDWEYGDIDIVEPYTYTQVVKSWKVVD